MADEQTSGVDDGIAEAIPNGEMSPAEKAVYAWVSEHIYNSPLSRSAEAWNHLHAVLPALVAKLENL